MEDATRNTWSWCFKPLIFLPKIQSSRLRKILSHFTSVRISFCRTYDRCTILLQDVLRLPFLNPGHLYACYAIEEDFYQSAIFDRYFYWITTLRFGSVLISLWQALSSFVCYWQLAEGWTRKRILCSGELSLGKMLTKKRYVRCKSIIFNARL